MPTDTRDAFSHSTRIKSGILHKARRRSHINLGFARVSDKLGGRPSDRHGCLQTRDTPLATAHAPNPGLQDKARRRSHIILGFLRVCDSLPRSSLENRSPCTEALASNPCPALHPNIFENRSPCTEILTSNRCPALARKLLKTDPPAQKLWPVISVTLLPESF